MATYVGTLGPRRMDSGLLSRRNRNESTSVSAADGGALWSYSSTATIANVLSTGWFSNAGQLGMMWGDIVFCAHYNSTGRAIDFTIGVCSSIGSTGQAELAVNAVIGSS